MEFIDHSVIRVSSGSGGAGLVSFKRGKNKPKLGPDGGDGGFGGSVYLRGNSQLNTLATLRFRQSYEAENGMRGGPNGRTGRNGEDMIIPVPIGTIAFDAESGECLGEVISSEQLLLIAKGGHRGIGNIRFLSSVQQAPEKSTPGGPGVSIELKLELKLLADIGLAGYPNAGKSTLLSVVSAARPKIADYPFTTLVPQLGVVELGKLASFFGESFVMADIPGLIEGAADGKGLGHAFLKHLERTKIIAYVIDALDTEERAPEDKLRNLRYELQRFSPELATKPGVIVLTKTDLIQDDEQLKSIIDKLSLSQMEIIPISAVSSVGLDQLKLRLAAKLRQVVLEPV